MAVHSLSTPFNFTLPSSSGSSIKKPIKSVSKPCFGCDCGDEDQEHGLLVPVIPVTKERLNVMRRFRSVIGVATIIFPAHSTE
ncbi:uncharacterized protein N7500_001421 [Penicillium coprophilum]|uniref:uncharacterized protein n=1 Tax=Penicillium coprophilum TaxID=36646 RepID=UPI00238F07D7|nr:uncharacterized protein N7500_001421 [Penicillium coprophilum]KAJ5173490.1 hypothetical protein N7500_001421 [Penicillium coprophilum]